MSPLMPLTYNFPCKRPYIKFKWAYLFVHCYHLMKWSVLLSISLLWKILTFLEMLPKYTVTLLLMLLESLVFLQKSSYKILKIEDVMPPSIGLLCTSTDRVVSGWHQIKWFILGGSLHYSCVDYDSIVWNANFESKFLHWVYEILMIQQDKPCYLFTLSRPYTSYSLKNTSSRWSATL